MSVTIDEEVLAAVQVVLETKTVKDTIEQAFLEVLRAKARKSEVEALRTQKGMDFGSEGVLSKACRP